MYKFTTFENKVYYSKYFPMDFKVKSCGSRDLKSFLFESKEEAFDFTIRDKSSIFFNRDFYSLSDNDKESYSVPHYLIKKIDRL